jgi:nucleoid DNA-binding protein
LSIKKADLIAILVDRWGVNKREASDLVDTMFAIITERMLAGEYGRFISLL